ncbi:MAG: SH3 domain-containing protein [Pseudomonadota bacterium]
MSITSATWGGAVAAQPRSVVVASVLAAVVLVTSGRALAVEEGKQAEVAQASSLWVGDGKPGIPVKPGDVVTVLKIRNGLARVKRASDGVVGDVPETGT